MYFVQFQEPPDFVTQETPDDFRKWIRTTIAIATQPTQVFLNEDITVRASLVSLNDDDLPILTALYHWHAGMSSLPIEFDVTRMGIACPVRVHVKPEHQDNETLALQKQSSRVFMALSSCFDSSGQPTSPERIERRFMLSNYRELRTCEYSSCGLDRHVKQLKSSGAALLSYLDSIIGLRTDGIQEIVRKFALATSRTLRVVDMSQNCGAIGIAIGQLIPASSVVVLDDTDAMPVIEENIRAMYPAISASVTFTDWNLDEASGTLSKAVDLLFVTPFSEGDGTSFQTEKVLRRLLERSPRAVVVYVEVEKPKVDGQKDEGGKRGDVKDEALEDEKHADLTDGVKEEKADEVGMQNKDDGIGGFQGEDEEHRVGKKCTISDVMREYGKALCGSERIPGGSVLPQYRVMVFRGNRRK